MHDHGVELKQQAALRKKEQAEYIKDIEKTFNINWEQLTINERDKYSVKYQRLKNPETQTKITAAVKTNHEQGKYAKAYEELGKCNQQSKKLKELCPTVDYDKFISIFGFDLRDIPGGPGGKRAPWITKYRKIVCKNILNHKVKAVEKLNTTADVYDLTIKDNHNFALSAGIFVHNSKDQSDGFCGALYNASLFASDYAYSYGESLASTFEVNMIDSGDMRKKQIINGIQDEIAKLYSDSNYLGYKKDADPKRQEELRRYQEIADGIIII